MNSKDLKRIVAAGENQHVEFKRKAAHPDKIMKEIVAFANTEGGGLLLLGVEDNKTIYGFANPDEEEFTIENAIRKYCYPIPDYYLYRVPLSDEVCVLALEIKEGTQKPYSVLYDFEQKLGKIYVRVADRSIQASREMREVLKIKAQGRSIRFMFGEKEKLLLEYLDKHSYITLEIFAALAGIKSKVASRTLVLLVTNGILQIHPHEEGQDQYTLKTAAGAD